MYQAAWLQLELTQKESIMDTNNQVTNAPVSQPGQPGFSQRMQHSKALVAIVAVLGVTVMALAAALVVNRSDAQPGASANLNEPAQVSKLAADTTTKPVAATPRPCGGGASYAARQRLRRLRHCGSRDAGAAPGPGQRRCRRQHHDRPGHR